MNIYVIRHGKTIFNTMGRSQGWSDSPLTPEGLQGAADVGFGLALAGIVFDRAYSGDLNRQRKTARLILDHMGQDELSVMEIEGFREVSFGCYEAAQDEEMYVYPARKYGCKNMEELWESVGLKPVVDAIAESDTLLHMAEDYDTACARMKSALDMVVQELESCGGNNAMVVTSGMALNCLIERLGGKVQGPLENCSVTKIVYDGQTYNIETIGDESYLKHGRIKTSTVK